ncbi:hypothetical protein PVAP13_8NG123001 [Panicum virgatum]|uniref:Uncharacterized protein n=1 Tax=Panicum virgatum TaxID=38727 RepID=A0A8T0P953_PANVG|nr:hypothetical protein PVAP13_8NG123001 [Panicum virgatum]
MNRSGAPSHHSCTLSQTACTSARKMPTTPCCSRSPYPLPHQYPTTTGFYGRRTCSLCSDIMVDLLAGRRWGSVWGAHINGAGVGTGEPRGGKKGNSWVKAWRRGMGWRVDKDDHRNSRSKNL